MPSKGIKLCGQRREKSERHALSHTRVFFFTYALLTEELFLNLLDSYEGKVIVERKNKIKIFI